MAWNTRETPPPIDAWICLRWFSFFCLCKPPWLKTTIGENMLSFSNHPTIKSQRDVLLRMPPNTAGEWALATRFHAVVWWQPLQICGGRPVILEPSNLGSKEGACQRFALYVLPSWKLTHIPSQARWCFNHFLFSPLLGEMIQFDYFFSDGLKPPKSKAR